MRVPIGQTVAVLALLLGAEGPALAQGQAQTKEPKRPGAEARVGPERFVDHGLEWVWSAPAGVYLARSEVMVAQYRACVEAGKCSPPKSMDGDVRCNWRYAERGEHPVNCLDWLQATDFCEWAGGRLPSEQEWEAEASDRGKRQYPWGEQEVSCERAIQIQGKYGCDKDTTWPVCSKPAGNSVSGLCDLSGNVWEWVSGPEGVDKAVRGGALNFGGAQYLSATGRVVIPLGSKDYDVGLRCARSAPPAH
jgi:formylglycine-generating enzyme required for sulfatase activity